MFSTEKSTPPLLLRLQSKVIPNVFHHPIWIDYISSNPEPSPDLIQDLLDSARRYEMKGDVISCCQILLISASLQKESNNFEAALETIQKALKLAEAYGLQQFAIWAAWAAGAISLLQGNYQRCTRYLSSLKDMFRGNNDWLSANLITLINDSLLKNPQGQGQEGLEEAFIWLSHWGEAPSIIDTRFRIGRKQGFQQERPQLSVSSSIFNFGRKIASWLKFSTDRKFSHKSGEVQLRQPQRTFGILNMQPNQPYNLGMSRYYNSAIPTLSNPELRANPYNQQGQANPFLMIYCLGPFRVYQDEQLIDNWSSRKGLAVFKYLITHHPFPVAKEVLMDTFWPDADPEAARRNLHQAVYTIRQTLNFNQSNIQHICFENDSYAISPELNIWLDCNEFEMHVDAGQRLEQYGSTDSAMVEYGIAESLYQGEFLSEDLYESWSQPRRQYFWQTYLSLAHRLAQYHLDRGEFLTAIALNRRILNMDISQELAHQMLIKCYLAQGQRQLALSQYHSCVRALRTELDLPPSAETQALHKEITSM